MSDIVVLRTSSEKELDERRANVVALLEEALAAAKRGEFVSCLLVLESPDGYRICHPSALDVKSRLGMIEMIKYDWLRGMGE